MTVTHTCIITLRNTDMILICHVKNEYPIPATNMTLNSIFPHLRLFNELSVHKD